MGSVVEVEICPGVVVEVPPSGVPSAVEIGAARAQLRDALDCIARVPFGGPTHRAAEHVRNALAMLGGAA